MNDKQLLRALSQPPGYHSIDVWRSTTQEQLQRLQAFMDAGRKKARRGALAVGMAVMLLVWVNYRGLSGATPGELAFIALGSLAYSAVVAVVAYIALSRRRHGAGELLRPLAEEPDECLATVGLLEIPSVVAYRDQVVANGRQLTLGDVRSMKMLASRARTEQSHTAAREACQKVHGMFDTPAAPVH